MKYPWNVNAIRLSPPPLGKIAGHFFFLNFFTGLFSWWVAAWLHRLTCFRAAGQEMCFQAAPVAESFLAPFRHHTLNKKKTLIKWWKRAADLYDFEGKDLVFENLKWWKERETNFFSIYFVYLNKVSLRPE